MWKPEGEVIKIYQNEPVATVVTKLNDEEEVIYVSKKEKAKSFLGIPVEEEEYNKYAQPWDGWDQEALDSMKMACSRIETAIIDLKSAVDRAIKNGKITESEMNELLHSLEVVEMDLDGSIRIISN